MRRQSKKRAALMAQVKPLRQELIRQVGKCEICGASPRKPKRGMSREMSELAVHEIARGPLRAKALDKRYATLVACWDCNTRMTDRVLYPECRQLAHLLLSRPGDYDLTAYNQLVCPAAPERITQSEVDPWVTFLKTRRR